MANSPPNQCVIEPKSGKELFLIAKRSTTPIDNTEAKKIFLKRELIEVIVSDSRLLSLGSQWGHVAIVIDGKVYSRSTSVYFTTTYSDYISRNSYRDSAGLLLSVSSREKNIVKRELERRVAVNDKYSLFSNSCSSNVEDVLEMINILAHDPRWIPYSVTPAEILAVVGKSNRFVKKNMYPKKVSAP